MNAFRRLRYFAHAWQARRARPETTGDAFVHTDGKLYVRTYPVPGAACLVGEADRPGPFGLLIKQF